MKELKKKILQILPYFLSLLSGCFLFWLSLSLKDNYKSLLINLSSAFIAIPLLYLIYELSQISSNKKLNKEIYDFAKMQIDRVFLSIVHQVIKLIYPYEKQDKSFKEINALLNSKESDIKDEIEQNKYLGFQALKNWYTSEKEIQELLNNSFIVEKLEDDQIIAIIEVLKNIRALQDIYRNIHDLYIISNHKLKGFSIQNGIDINPVNSNYSDRYILLKDLGNQKSQVYDFGDFEKYKVSELLFECRVNPKYTKFLSQSIYEVIQSINNWLDKTGLEFIVDTRMYKFKSSIS